MDSSTPTVRSLQAAEAEAFAAEVLLSPARAKPVVAVTTKSAAGAFLLDPARVASALGDGAEVLGLVTGDATWALSQALPKRLDVFGGAVRIWWPGLTRESNPLDHPLLFIWNAEDAERVLGRVASLVADRAAAGARSAPAARADPWKRLAAAYAVGDVVPARVSRIADRYVLVELLPHATAIVLAHELDWTRFGRPGDLYKGGEVVAVKLLTLEPRSRRCSASIKEAFGKPITKRVEPGPGEAPFPPEPAEAPGEARGGAGEARYLAEGRAARLQEELESVLEDRERLMQELGAARRQVADLRKELRGAEERLRARAEQGPWGIDPASSETAFLAAVRVEYARRLDEGDRAQHPLRRMRVGREFLARLRGLDGIEIGKVIEVCAQVACGRAHESAGRRVHELRSGAAGAAGRTRASDGAKAWRCALQVGTPSARRLHWWLVPGPEGATVEFAGVSLHDDFSIPE